MPHSAPCIFCEFQHDQEKVVAKNDCAYAVRDGYAVTEMHTLIIPLRHVEDYFGLTDEEREAVDDLLKSQREAILQADDTVEGFNIGMNCGAVAGQTIFHCHVHLIPRRKGDVENPRGGVRYVIPEKANY